MFTQTTMPACKHTPPWLWNLLFALTKVFLSLSLCVSNLGHLKHSLGELNCKAHCKTLQKVAKHSAAAKQLKLAKSCQYTFANLNRPIHPSPSSYDKNQEININPLGVNILSAIGWLSCDEAERCYSGLGECKLYA